MQIDDSRPLAQQIADDLEAQPDTSVAALRRRRREWSSALRSRPAAEVFDVAIRLLVDFHYRWIAYELLAGHAAAFGLVCAENVERLACGMQSWAEVDQFSVLLAGPAWRSGLIADAQVVGWAERSDRWWRRAALVATVPLNVRARGGGGDVPRTLAICERLLEDRDDLIAKAMSWALRELVLRDRHAVDAFITANHGRLAPLVRREVRNKLVLGLKHRRSSESATLVGGRG